MNGVISSNTYINKEMLEEFLLNIYRKPTLGVGGGREVQ